MRGTNAHGLISILLFVGLWLAAPHYHACANRPDEAAWVQMYMGLTSVVGVVVCLINFKVKNKRLLAAIYVVLLVHVIVGLGLHPR
jgi:hypothetical protein